MRKILIIVLCCLPICVQAQEKGLAYAQLKIWDSHHRFPKINEIEFQGADETLATYDAIYGHGVMWESDFIGFRIYMDHRQSIDLYGKKHAQLELDSTNFYSNREWLAKGYGEDILWVGESIGAGSFRGNRGGKPCYVDKVKARGQRIINPGPEQVIVEVWDQDWELNGKTLQMRQSYTMRAGHRDVQVDIYLEGASDKDVFFTGAQKFELKTEAKNGKIKTKDGQKGICAATWGSNIPDKSAPDLVETLGLAVFVPNDYLAEDEVRETDVDYLIALHPVKGHIRYHIAACSDMQQEGGWHSAKEWFNWVWKKLELPKQKK